MKYDREQDPQNLPAILSTSKRKLGWLLSKASMLHQLESLIHEILEQPLNQHCRVLNYEQAVLTLATDTAAHATQLRYQSRNLINQLHFYQTYNRLYKIDIKVSPNLTYTS